MIPTRMLSWLALAAIFYTLAIVFIAEPQVSTGLWKFGHVTAGAYIGFWIDRHAFSQVTLRSTDGRLLVRAVIMAAAILGVCFGL